MNDEEVDEFETFNWEVKPPYHKFVWFAVRSVGWYIVAISIVLVYTWPYISKKWKSWKKKRDDMEYDAKYHKDVDLNTEILIATQLARERMQEKYLKDREIALRKEEERKEKKKQELLRLQNENSFGERLGSNPSEDAGPSTSQSSKSKLKGDYNPLMGGSGGRYIPPKRSCCGKGGCG